MSDLWIDQQTPTTEKVMRRSEGYWMIDASTAQKMERRMRAAEALLNESIAAIHPGLRTIWQEKAYNHLASAKEMDGAE